MNKNKKIINIVLFNYAKYFSGLLFLSILLTVVFRIEAAERCNYYPYITNTLPVQGYVKELIVSKKTPNALFALVGYDGKPKPTDKTGLYVFDISDTAKIRPVSYWPIKSPVGMELSPDGKYLFLYADKNSSGDWYGILALDVSNPKVIRQAGRIDINPAQARLSADGSILFVKERHYGQENILKDYISIFRVSTIDKPKLLVRLAHAYFYNLFPTPDGKYLILSNSEAFDVYDISNPSEPREKIKLSPNLGHLRKIGNDGMFYFVKGLRENTLIVATIMPKVEIIATFKRDYSSCDIRYISEDNKTVYISTIDRSIYVIGLSDKKNPRELMQYNTPNHIGSVAPSINNKLLYTGLLGSVIVIDTAKAVANSENLINAHAEALKQYNRKDDKYDLEKSRNAINLLEAAGIKLALKKKPSDISDDIFANILNDYAFFLEKKYRREEAIDIYRKAISLDPKRAVAYLNLGDYLRKQLSKAESFRKKIAMTKEIKTAYLKYRELTGKTTSAIDSFLRHNVIDTPNKNICEYVAAYANEGRLDELFGSGESVKKKDGQGTMQVEILEGGTAHIPYVTFTDNQTGEEIDYEIPGSDGDNFWTDSIDIVPFRDGHHLLYYDSGAYLVLSVPVGIAENTGRNCDFAISVAESFDENAKDPEICNLVQSSKHSPFIPFKKSDYLNKDIFKDAGYTSNWISESGTAEVDFNNDGKKETLVLLDYESGAGPGCGYKFFELLNGEKNGFSKSKQRDILLQMQDIKKETSSLHPVPFCRRNKTGWFLYKGITYYETKYPEKQPRNSDQEFHTVSYIKNGKINKVCEAHFKLQVKVKK